MAPKRKPPATSPGRVLVRPAPVPSWPYALDPQHEISPARDRAQECANPARTVLNGPAAPTLTGVFRWSVVASPSCPRSLLPQQYASPSRVTPHVCDEPALSCAKTRSPATVAGAV